MSSLTRHWELAKRGVQTHTEPGTTQSWAWTVTLACHEMLEVLRGRFSHCHPISQFGEVQTLPGVKGSESHPKQGGKRCVMKSFFMSDDLSSLEFSRLSASLLRRLLSFLLQSAVFTC